MRFLIIDHSPTMRRAIINTLRAFGYEEFEEAENGVDGMNILQNSEIDFVTTEWDMPNMTGIELVKLIREDEKLKNIFILMITSRDSKADIVEALKAKVDNYVVKPFATQTLKEKIEIVLNDKHRDPAKMFFL
ncbi:MAG: response regulator [FCB group bacterium]|jgi:two-component system chemotaxis response regulator CheY